MVEGSAFPFKVTFGMEILSSSKGTLNQSNPLFVSQVNPGPEPACVPGSLGNSAAQASRSVLVENVPKASP